MRVLSMAHFAMDNDKGRLPDEDDPSHGSDDAYTITPEMMRAGVSALMGFNSPQRTGLSESTGK